MSRASGRRGGGRKGDLPLNAEINVTSLVDVAFTLLVIFIITMPILQGGIEVALPQGQVRTISASDNPFIVSVERDGTIYVGETQVDRAVFEETFPRLLRVADTDIVYIRGDSLAMYGTVFQVVSAAAVEEGVRFGLIGEQLPPARR